MKKLVKRIIEPRQLEFDLDFSVKEELTVKIIEQTNFNIISLIREAIEKYASIPKTIKLEEYLKKNCRAELNSKRTLIYFMEKPILEIFFEYDFSIGAFDKHKVFNVDLFKYRFL
jgi:hypothetical protein